METMLQALVIVGGLTFSLATSLVIEELIFGQIVRMAFASRRETPNRFSNEQNNCTEPAMLLLKYFLLTAGISMFLIAAGILSCDAYLLIAFERRRSPPDPEAGTLGPAPVVRWRTSLALVVLAWAP